MPKILLYSLTLALAMFFAFWELRLKRQLTDSAATQNARLSEFGMVNDLSKRMNRERVIAGLPREALNKFRTVVALKFLFVAILIVEVIILQKPK